MNFSHQFSCFVNTLPPLQLPRLQSRLCDFCQAKSVIEAQMWDSILPIEITIPNAMHDNSSEGQTSENHSESMLGSLNFPCTIVALSVATYD